MVSLFDFKANRKFLQEPTAKKKTLLTSDSKIRNSRTFSCCQYANVYWPKDTNFESCNLEENLRLLAKW